MAVGGELEITLRLEVGDLAEIEIEVERNVLLGKGGVEIEVDQQRLAGRVVHHRAARPEDRDQPRREFLHGGEGRAVVLVEQLLDVVGGRVGALVVDQQGLADEIGELEDPAQGIADQRHIDGERTAVLELVEPTGDLPQQAHQGAGVHVGEVAQAVLEQVRHVDGDRVRVGQIGPRHRNGGAGAGRNAEERRAHRQAERGAAGELRLRGAQRSQQFAERDMTVGRGRIDQRNREGSVRVRRAVDDADRQKTEARRGVQVGDVGAQTRRGVRILDEHPGAGIRRMRQQVVEVDADLHRQVETGVDRRLGRRLEVAHAVGEIETEIEPVTRGETAIQIQVERQRVRGTVPGQAERGRIEPEPLGELLHQVLGGAETRAAGQAAGERLDHLVVDGLDHVDDLAQRVLQQRHLDAIETHRELPDRVQLVEHLLRADAQEVEHRLAEPGRRGDRDTGGLRHVGPGEGQLGAGQVDEVETRAQGRSLGRQLEHDVVLGRIAPDRDVDLVGERRTQITQPQLAVAAGIAQIDLEEHILVDGHLLGRHVQVEEAESPLRVCTAVERDIAHQQFIVGTGGVDEEAVGIDAELEVHHHFGVDVDQTVETDLTAEQRGVDIEIGRAAERLHDADVEGRPTAPIERVGDIAGNIIERIDLVTQGVERRDAGRADVGQAERAGARFEEPLQALRLLERNTAGACGARLGRRIGRLALVACRRTRTRRDSHDGAWQRVAENGKLVRRAIDQAKPVEQIPQPAADAVDEARFGETVGEGLDVAETRRLAVAAPDVAHREGRHPGGRAGGVLGDHRAALDHQRVVAIAAVEHDRIGQIDQPVVDIDGQRVVAAQAVDVDPLHRRDRQGEGRVHRGTHEDVEQGGIAGIAVNADLVVAPGAVDREHRRLREDGVGVARQREQPSTQGARRHRVGSGRTGHVDVTDVAHRGIRQPAADLGPGCSRRDGRCPVHTLSRADQQCAIAAARVDHRHGLQTRHVQLRGDRGPVLAAVGGAEHARAVHRVSDPPVGRIDSDIVDLAAAAEPGAALDQGAGAGPDEHLVEPRLVDEIGVADGHAGDVRRGGNPGVRAGRRAAADREAIGHNRVDQIDAVVGTGIAHRDALADLEAVGDEAAAVGPCDGIRAGVGEAQCRIAGQLEETAIGDRADHPVAAPGLDAAHGIEPVGALVEAVEPDQHPGVVDLVEHVRNDVEPGEPRVHRVEPAQCGRIIGRAGQAVRTVAAAQRHGYEAADQGTGGVEGALEEEREAVRHREAQRAVRAGERYRELPLAVGLQDRSERPTSSGIVRDAVEIDVRRLRQAGRLFGGTGVLVADEVDVVERVVRDRIDLAGAQVADQRGPRARRAGRVGIGQTIDAAVVDLDERAIRCERHLARVGVRRRAVRIGADHRRPLAAGGRPGIAAEDAAEVTGDAAGVGIRHTDLSGTNRIRRGVPGREHHARAGPVGQQLEVGDRLAATVQAAVRVRRAVHPGPGHAEIGGAEQSGELLAVDEHDVADRVRIRQRRTERDHAGRRVDARDRRAFPLRRDEHAGVRRGDNGDRHRVADIEQVRTRHGDRVRGGSDHHRRRQTCPVADQRGIKGPVAGDTVGGLAGRQDDALGIGNIGQAGTHCGPGGARVVGPEDSTAKHARVEPAGVRRIAGHVGDAACRQSGTAIAGETAPGGAAIGRTEQAALPLDLLREGGICQERATAVDIERGDSLVECAREHDLLAGDLCRRRRDAGDGEAGERTGAEQLPGGAAIGALEHTHVEAGAARAAERAGACVHHELRQGRCGAQRCAIAIQRADLDVADRQRRKLVGQRRPVGAAVGGAPDAAVHRPGEHHVAVEWMHRKRLHGADHGVVARHGCLGIEDRAGSLLDPGRNTLFVDEAGAEEGLDVAHEDELVVALQRRGSVGETDHGGADRTDVEGVVAGAAVDHHLGAEVQLVELDGVVAAAGVDRQAARRGLCRQVLEGAVDAVDQQVAGAGVIDADRVVAAGADRRRRSDVEHLVDGDTRIHRRLHAAVVEHVRVELNRSGIRTGRGVDGNVDGPGRQDQTIEAAGTAVDQTDVRIRADHERLAVVGAAGHGRHVARDVPDGFGGALPFDRRGDGGVDRVGTDVDRGGDRRRGDLLQLAGDGRPDQRRDDVRGHQESALQRLEHHLALERDGGLVPPGTDHPTEPFFFEQARKRCHLHLQQNAAAAPGTSPREPRYGAKPTPTCAESGVGCHGIWLPENTSNPIDRRVDPGRHCCKLCVLAVRSPSGRATDPPIGLLLVLTTPQPGSSGRRGVAWIHPYRLRKILPARRFVHTLHRR